MASLESVNLIIGVAGFVLSAIGLEQAISSYQLEKKTGRYFIAFFILLMAYTLFDLEGQAAAVHQEPGWVLFARVSLFLESALASALTLLLTDFLLCSSGARDWRRGPDFLLPFALWMIYLAMLIYTQYSGVLYSIGDDNVYRRGALYPFLLAPPVLIMAHNLFLLWRVHGSLSRKERSAFAVYALIPMISMVIQMVFYGVYVVVLGTSIGALYMSSYIISDQTERYYSQVAENEKLKVSIMLSQIQPHFLYNALASIRELCDSDPQEAGRATSMFAQYLRGNMDSLTAKEAVPFSVELEHTKIFMELEQMRFESGLRVVYDITCTDFKIPTLTLQPLAENAVTHGVRGEERDVGTVTISTREYADCWEVSVRDDGPGFDPNAPLPNDGRSHVGLKNVRERLHRVSGGDLRIESRRGKGTTVTIVLPKETEKR